MILTLTKNLGRLSKTARFSMSSTNQIKPYEETFYKLGGIQFTPSTNLNGVTQRLFGNDVI